MSLLDIAGLSASLGRKAVLDRVSLAIDAGECVGLIGPNGAGKSTLLRAVLGLVPHDGAISLTGQQVASLAPDEMARRIAYLPQEREIAWPVSVERIVGLGRMPHGTGAREPDDADRRIILEAMRAMDVAGLARAARNRAFRRRDRARSDRPGTGPARAAASGRRADCRA